MNILQDIKTAVKLTGEIRKARKQGASAVQIRPVRSMPVLKAHYWGYTMECCLVHDWEMKETILTVFRTFPESVQHSLTFTPKEPGGWVERARFWQQHLKPALPPKMYHAAMVKFVHWYAHCLRMRKETPGLD